MGRPAVKTHSATHDVRTHARTHVVKPHLRLAAKLQTFFPSVPRYGACAALQTHGQQRQQQPNRRSAPVRSLAQRALARMLCILNSLQFNESTR